MIISSKDNEQIKNIRKLKDKKYRKSERKYIIEGIKLVKEAISEKMNIDAIVISEVYQKEMEVITKECEGKKIIYVTENVFETISEVENSQGIIAVINKEKNKTSISYNEDIIVVLDNIQDPGNLGTILRTIDSIGVKQVIVSNTTVDCYNPKVVRSTMGAIFRVNVIETNNIVTTIEEIKANGFKVAVTTLEDSKSIYKVDYNKIAIVIGNEANGVSEKVKEIADIKMKIPMLGKTESLNAGVATAIVLYEYVRRKEMNKNELL